MFVAAFTLARLACDKAAPLFKLTKINGNAAGWHNTHISHDESRCLPLFPIREYISAQLTYTSIRRINAMLTFHSFALIVLLLLLPLLWSFCYSALGRMEMKCSAIHNGVICASMDYMGCEWNKLRKFWRKIMQQKCIRRLQSLEKFIFAVRMHSYTSYTQFLLPFRITWFKWHVFSAAQMVLFSCHRLESGVWEMAHFMYARSYTLCSSLISYDT